MNILGIDPGYDRIGVAILNKDKNLETLLYSDCFQTPKELDVPDRINLFITELDRLIQEYSVTELAIENLFFQNNQKTAMRVAEARGAMISTAKQSGLSVFEYTPLQIKQAVTGYGRANKEQVQTMVKQLVRLEDRKYIDDEIDAIATALTHSASRKLLSL